MNHELFTAETIDAPPRARRPAPAWLLIGLLILAGLSVPTQAATSIKLKDVIKSNGIGSVDLFKDVTASTLEALRSENGGRLIFGVDVNEAANGTEKADSQGIALKSVKLTVNFSDGPTRVYQMTGVGATDNQCFTKTKALLAETPGIARKEWYTLLGETGSSRITAKNAIQNQFDDTLTVLVPDSLATATKAILDVVLLDTNVKLGDPEAFYDFTNGFEDLALLSREDAAFIDGYAAGRTGAPLVILTPVPSPADPLTIDTWTFYPAANKFYLVGYEDAYPEPPPKTDYDFNDLTVAFQVQQGLNNRGELVAIHGTAYLVTRGAAYDHDWHLQFSLPAEIGSRVTCTYQRGPAELEVKPCSADNRQKTTGSVDLIVFERTAAIFRDPSGSTFVNTQADKTFVKGPRAYFAIDFATPLTAANIPKPPFNAYLHVRNTGQNIQLLEVNASFRDKNGFPYGMVLPTGWQPPLEKTNLLEAYGTFTDFIATRGTQGKDWYLRADGKKIRGLPATSEWAW